jgi:hypothetical protein
MHLAEVPRKVMQKLVEIRTFDHAVHSLCIDRQENFGILNIVSKVSHIYKCDKPSAVGNSDMLLRFVDAALVDAVGEHRFQGGNSLLVVDKQLLSHGAWEVPHVVVGVLLDEHQDDDEVR